MIAGVLKMILNAVTKRLSWILVGVIITVVLAVLYVPGVAEYIEGTMLGWLGRVSL